MPVPLKVDSGQDWTMIPTRDCKTCSKYAEEKCDKIFDSSDSKHSCGDGYDPSEEFATLIKKGVHRVYGTTNLTGKVWENTLCLSKYCVIDFPFFSYHKEKTLTKFPFSSSVLGLSQKNTESKTGPLFTDYLYQQKSISRDSFSFAMIGYKDSDTKYFEFGFHDPSRLKKNSTTIMF
jgi:hypothetical protein